MVFVPEHRVLEWSWRWPVEGERWKKPEQILDPGGFRRPGKNGNRHGVGRGNQRTFRPENERSLNPAQCSPAQPSSGSRAKSKYGVCIAPRNDNTRTTQTRAHSGAMWHDSGGGRVGGGGILVLVFFLFLFPKRRACAVRCCRRPTYGLRPRLV